MPEYLHLHITDFVEFVLYFKIPKRNDGAMRAEPNNCNGRDNQF
jgi:hypothetical protein